MSKLPGDWPSLSLIGLARTPLSLPELEHLYAATDWRVVACHRLARHAYGTFSPIAMFKALSLPYLINIESEAALARELAERDPLRSLCGFAASTPTRPMFWHFRHTPRGFYAEVMLQALIALVLSGQRPNLTLPFVSVLAESAEEPDGHYFKFRLDDYRPEIEVWLCPPEPMPARPQTAGKTVAQLYREVKRAEKARRRQGLSAALRLPAEVRTTLIDGAVVGLAIDKPDWLRPHSGYRSGGQDTLTTVGSALSIPYSACHVMVVRGFDNQQEVLLGRRLAGYGKGYYMLPGGKAGPDESLEVCTARELHQETGLRALNSRPVSIRRWRLPGRPPVFSIGALVDAFEGVPRNREPGLTARWEWVDMDALPPNLFEPVQLIVEDYRAGRVRDLRWSDVEIQRRGSASHAVQLSFDGVAAG